MLHNSKIFNDLLKLKLEYNLCNLSYKLDIFKDLITSIIPWMKYLQGSSIDFFITFSDGWNQISRIEQSQKPWKCILSLLLIYHRTRVTMQ